MSNFLIRGIPRSAHERIQRYARSQNLSLNQILVRWFLSFIEQVEEREEKERREKEAFRRIREIREEIARRPGKRMNSLKLLKEARKERMRRYDSWIK